MLEMATLRRDSEVEAIMEMSEKQIEALGFTEHSRRHAGIVSKWSGEILRALGSFSEKELDDTFRGDKTIEVCCQFCDKKYVFTREEIEAYQK